jgi:signal transduction histidine kinase
MQQDIVASVSLGFVIFTALALLALGVTIGWLGASARFRRKSSRGELSELSQMNALLRALPQAALTTNSEAHILAQNTTAMQLLRELKWNESFPLVVDAAISRVIRSGVAESIEVVATGRSAPQVQVMVAPLYTSGSNSAALLMLMDLSAASNRAEVYQRLISTIAHEVRTPLTAILGHVEILNSCGLDEEALWRRSLSFVSGETERLARLVEDLLNLSRLDRISLHLQPMNLRVAAEEAVSALFDSAERNNVKPVFQAPTHLPRVLADPDPIRQVFLNLLDNAIKYAPGSAVTVRLTPEAGRIRVEVSDTGPGIPREDLPHIFEPFRRSERAGRSSKGTGLGLTIVRAILDQHQAPIRVQSEPERGTTFSFSLPIAHSTDTG